MTEIVYGAMSAADVQKAVEKEFEMALQDRVMEETKDKKNAVESYVYDMRNKVCVGLIVFVCFVAQTLIKVLPDACRILQKLYIFGEPDMGVATFSESLSNLGCMKIFLYVTDKSLLNISSFRINIKSL